VPSGSGVLPGFDAELLHARDQRGAIHTHTRGSAVCAAHLSLGFCEGANDFFPLLLGVFVDDSSPAIEGGDGLLQNTRDIPLLRLEGVLIFV
jgi:hypothetical protein